MPQIKEYIAPEFRITPSSAGYTAMENAGRRIGPLYDEAAKEINARGTIANEEARAEDQLGSVYGREAQQVDALKSMYDEEGRQQAALGKLQGDLIKEKMWPYDIFKLYNEDAQAAEAKQKSLGPNKGITVFREGFTASGINKAQGTGGSLDQPDTTYISGTDDAIGGPGSPRWDSTSSSTGSGSASRGAALMGYALSDGGNAISTGYGAADNNTSTTNQTGGPAGFDVNGNPLYSNAAPQAAYNSAGQPIYSYAPGDALSQAGMAIYNAQDSALGGQNTLGYANALAAYNSQNNYSTTGLMYNTGVQSGNLTGETQPAPAAAPGFFDNWFGTGAGSPTDQQSGPQGAQD